MSSLEELQLESDGNSHRHEEFQSQKRPQSGAVQNLPPAKRLRRSKDDVQSARKPRVPGRGRVSGAKLRGVGPEDAEKPIWSVVACSDSPPKIRSLRQTDTRPRLWTSTRKELTSTFTELSGSKCVNNISWASTDMPILILDDEFISVDKPNSIGSELHMDISMVREFVCATEDAFSREDVVDTSPTQSVATPVESVANDIGLSQFHTPSARPSSEFGSQPQQTYEHKSTALTSTDFLDILSPTGSANAAETSVSEIIGAPKSKAKGAMPKQVKPLEPPPQESHSPPVPQAPHKPTQAKATRTTLSSLRFKKIKKPTPDTPANPETSQTVSSGQSPFSNLSPLHDSPQPGIGGASEPSPFQAQVGHAPPSIRPTTSSPPVLHSSRSAISNPPQVPSTECPMPDTPMSELGMGIHKQTNIEPVLNHYPDNRFLPQLPEIFAEKRAMSLPTSFAYHPVMNSRVDAIQPGYFAGARAPIDKVVTLSKSGGCTNIDSRQLPVGVECQCSRFKYNRDCPYCRVYADANNKLLSPNIQSDDSLEKGKLMEVGVGQLAGLATYPNDIPLGRVRAWNRGPTVGFAFPLGVGEWTGTKRPDTQSLPPFAIPREFPTAPVTDSRAGGISGPNARPTPLGPQKPVPVAIGNTVHQVRDQRDVPTLASYATHPPNPPHVALHAPRLIGDFHQPVRPTLPSGAFPPNIVTQETTHNSALDKAPKPPLTPVLLPPEPSVVSEKETAPASLKRKGKEKAREVESSEEEPLSLGAEHQRAAKKPKLHAAVTNEQYAPRGSMDLNYPAVSTACSSKTKLEDLPVTPSIQTSLQIEVRAPNEEKKEVPQISISAAGKPVKRRGRPPKSAKAAVNIPQPVGQPMPMQVDSSTPQPQHPSQPPPKPKSRAKPKPQAISAPVPSAPVRRGENGVPMPIPDEIQALVDAYINGVPIGVFAAKKYVQGFWGLKLMQEEEVGYAFMGFYRISRLLENLTSDGGDGEGGADDKREKGVVGTGVSRAKVRWRFRMKWEPGGEDWQVRGRDNLSSPWWNPPLKAQGLSALPQSDLADSDNESTMMYRLARKDNPNFARRRCFFNQAFYSVLPLHLLAPIDAEIPDSALPRGWHCEDCGKLNFRYYLRHRRCGSSYCKDKPEVEGYAVDIDRMRDPQDALPLSLPLSEMPSQGFVDFKVQTWSDRMKTLVYQFKVGPGHDRGPAVVQHVFTGNLKDLQKDPSQLLSEIQIHVPLRRPTGDASSNPYFTYFAGDGKGVDGRTFVPWEAAPGCLQRAKDLMKSRRCKYGKKPMTELDIRSLEIRAWVTTGSRRSSDLLSVKQRCMVIMCLGCEAIMTISPKSAIVSNNDQPRMSDLDEMIPMEGFDPEGRLKMEAQPGEGVKMEVEEMESASKDTKDQIQSLSMASAKAVPRGQKVEKVVLSVSLLHGDILLLEGDDFEYSIKRTGTSISPFDDVERILGRTNNNGVSAWNKDVWDGPKGAGGFI